MSADPLARLASDWDHVCSFAYGRLLGDESDRLPLVCWSWHHGLHLPGCPDYRVEVVVQPGPEMAALPRAERCTAPEEPGDPWLIGHLDRDATRRMLSNDGFDPVPGRVPSALLQHLDRQAADGSDPFDVDLYLRARTSALVLEAADRCYSPPADHFTEQMVVVVEAALAWV